MQNCICRWLHIPKTRCTLWEPVTATRTPWDAYWQLNATAGFQNWIHSKNYFTRGSVCKLNYKTCLSNWKMPFSLQDASVIAIEKCFLVHYRHWHRQTHFMLCVFLTSCLLWPGLLTVNLKWIYLLIWFCPASQCPAGKCSVWLSLKDTHHCLKRSESKQKPTEKGGISTSDKLHLF